MEVYIVLASISYLWPFEAVEVVGGNMVKKQDFGSEKKYLRIFIQLLAIFLLQMGQSPQKAIDEKYIFLFSSTCKVSEKSTLNFMVRLVYQLCTCVFNTSFDRSQ